MKSKAIFTAATLLCLGVALAVLFAASGHAAASGHPTDGGGGDVSLKSWDTDNLRYAAGRYSARSFNVPFHQYGGYSGVAACQSGVADAFFQAGGSVGAVNDFPYLDWVADADGNESWAVQEGGTRNKGCDEFVEQQDEMAARIVGNGGYYLDLSGNLQKLSDGSVPSRFSGRSLVYGDWDRKGSGFAINSGTGEVVSGSGYLDRVDGYDNPSVPGTNEIRAIYPYGTKWVVPENTEKGRFGARWHGTTSPTSSSNIRVARPAGGVVSGGYLPIGAGLCPSRFHPRGEDSVERIGSHTGRTLTGLTHATGKVSDQFWCRSDLRFERRFHPEFHRGVAKHRQAATKEFTAYGRLNCYFTAFGAAYKASGTNLSSLTRGIHRDSSGGMVCSYLFPIPQCDPDPDNNSSTDWRDYTAAEIAAAGTIGQPFNKPDGADCGENTPQCTHNGTKRDMTDAELAEYRKDDASFTPAADGSTPCSANPADPPQQAGFTADACVTASLEIYENRIAGSDAEPGVAASDQTLAVAAGRSAWDLDITSPHHNTASPPRDVASTPADATGCADGSESRADHSSDAGSAARKNTAAGVDLALPASSAAAQSTHPPHSKGFASAGTDYTGAVKNMAHRYASRVAENTCAVKRAEAELVLALGRSRADMFSRGASGSDLGGYAARYAADVESNRKLFSNASPKGYKEKLEAVVVDNSVHKGYWLSWFNTNKTDLLSRANSKNTAADNFKSALDTARANHKRTTDAVALRSFTSGSCVAHWNAEIARIAGLFSSADSVFSNAIAISKRAYHNSYDNYVKATFSATTAAPTSSESVMRSNPFFVTAISITSRYCNQGQGTLDGSQCKRTESYTTRVPLTAAERAGCESFINASETLSAAEKSRMIRSHCRTKSVSRTRTITTAAHRNYSRSAARTVTYTTTGAYNGATNPVSSSCPITISITWTSEESQPAWPQGGGCTPGKSHAVRYYEAVGASPSLPSAPIRLAVASYPSAPAAVPVHKAALLGKYDPANTARNDLNSSIASTRDTAANNLGTLTSATAGAVSKTSFAASAVTAPYGLAASRTSVETEAGDYKTAYTGAYNTAYTQATADMGSTATTTTWNNFDWRYHSPSLAWGNYQEDPATTYSASTATPRDGTGCDLVNVASDGTVSVEATRLDYETSSYGKGSIYSTRTDAQRTCKIRRTRTPELILEYQPSRPSGTDTSKAVSSFHVDYQPTPAAERFKLYDEAEVFAVKTSLADRAPVLCYQPGEALVAHVAAKGVDAVNKAVFRNASGFAGDSKKHCYRHP